MTSIIALVMLGQTPPNGFCPPDNAPIMCGKTSRGGTSRGDPVDFGQGRPTGWLSRVDFTVPTPAGAFEFTRTMATRWTPSQLPWAGNSSEAFFFNVAKPFGGAAIDDGMYWWHSLMPMVQAYSDSTPTHVRTTSGRWIKFQSAPQSCSSSVVPLDAQQTRENVLLTCNGR
jgi:hypothetical protein